CRVGDDGEPFVPRGVDLVSGAKFHGWFNALDGFLKASVPVATSDRSADGEKSPYSPSGMQHTVVSLASSDAVAVEAFEQWNDHPPVGAEHLTEVAGGGRTAFAQAL